MNISMTQNLEQQQKLILTNEMQQSLKVLQMTLVELQTEISKELEENPVLEVEQKDIEKEDEENFGQKDSFEISKLIIEKSDFDYDYGNYGSNDENSSYDLYSFIAEKPTLRDYLQEQLWDLNENDSVIIICEYIINNLNEKGYLDCTLENIADDLNITMDEAAYSLNLVQGFQPWGIAARDLKECLQIQLRKKNIIDENIYELIASALELIADNKLKEIAKKLKLDIKKVQEYCTLIRSLDPKPSRGFNTGEFEKFAIPEANIKKIGDEFYILMNGSNLPKLIISQQYREIIKSQEDKAVVGYVKDKLSSAINLIKSIESRSSTIYNILDKIVQNQRKYFEFGEKYLKPMTISDIAAELGIHESTVSRAIRDKYIETPFGTVRIKDLFTTGIESSISNENISSNIIKKEIKTIIDSENKSKPMSDQDICEALLHKKIEISRRTVAKYREEMNIASSSKRKIF